MTSVEAQFELSKPAGLATLRWGVTARAVRYLAALGLVLIAAGGGTLAASTVGGFGLIAVGLLQLLIAAWVYWIFPSRTWRRRLAGMGSVTFTFSDDGVEMRALDKDSSMNWTRVTKVVELPNLYILQLSGTTGRLPVPKQAFSSDAGQAEFRRLAAEHTSVDFR